MLVFGINRAKLVRELLNKRFEQEVENIITSFIIRGQNDRVYYGIGRGMCSIKIIDLLKNIIYKASGSGELGGEGGYMTAGAVTLI